jgi:uncharacterized damage-inducible protein DinB
MNNPVLEKHIRSLGYEAGLTAKIFGAVTGDKKSERPNADTRSLERLAWHLTQTMSEMPHKAGLLESDDLEGRAIPETMEEIIRIHGEKVAAVQEALRSKWTDASLADEVNMYGESWSKDTILDVLSRHEIHHRGQMTMLMRVLGMKVPGIYGPAKEEWAAWNMPAMD